MKKLIPLFILAVFFAIALACPAMAGKGGKGKSRDAENPAAANQNKEKGEEEIFGFSEDEVEIITGVLKQLYGDADGAIEIVRPSPAFCPPGLAKKNNGCMPPGLAKKYSIGAPLPENAVLSPLPVELQEMLGLPPKGKKYVRLDQDILLIAEGTKLVLDAIGLGGGQ